MTYIIKHRRGDASLWSSANPILADGELGIESDTNKMKSGDGETAWNDLDYIAGGVEVPSYTDEQVRDVVAAALVAGTNIVITPNDGSDTITIGVTGIPGYTDEQTRDAIAAALVAGSGITITPNDGADTITIAATSLSSYTDEQVRDVIGAALVAGSGMSITPNDAGDTITLAATLNAAGHYQVDSLSVGPNVNPDYDLIAMYISPPVASDDKYAIMLLTTPASPNGDDSDPNIDKAALVKHHMDYSLTPRYAHTFQVYAEAGVRCLILGCNSFSELNKAIPYAFTPGGGWTPDGAIRFELGPETPYSEKMRLNNGGDLIVGWDFIRSNSNASQSGTTVTWASGGFLAGDVGKFILWGTDVANGGGTHSEVDRITAYISSTQVTVERSRSISSQPCNVVAARTLIDHLGNVEIKGDLTVNGTFSGAASYTDEQVRDVIGAALVAGSGITVTVNDAGDTITIAATGGGSYTDEQVRDVIGAALVAGSGISLSVNDAGDTITITNTGGGGGSGWNPRGVWAAATAYAAGDEVKRAGGSYVAQDSSTGSDPASASTASAGGTTGTAVSDSFGAETTVGFTVSEEVVVTAIQVTKAGASNMTPGKKIGLTRDHISGRTIIDVPWLGVGTVQAGAVSGTVAIVLDRPVTLLPGPTYRCAFEETMIDYYTTKNPTGKVASVSGTFYGSGPGTGMGSLSTTSTPRFVLLENSPGHWRLI